MDREAWWAAVHRVTKSPTQLKWLSMQVWRAESATSPRSSSSFSWRIRSRNQNLIATGMLFLGPLKKKKKSWLATALFSEFFLIQKTRLEKTLKSHPTPSLVNLFCSITSKALPLCCWSTSHCRKLTTWHPSHDVLSLQTSSYWNVLLCNKLRSWSLSSSPIVSLRVGPHSEWIKLYRTICSAHWLQPSHSLCLLSSQLTTSPVTPCQVFLLVFSVGVYSGLSVSCQVDSL